MVQNQRKIVEGEVGSNDYEVAVCVKYSPENQSIASNVKNLGADKTTLNSTTINNIRTSFFKTIYRTLAFTYLNPHVYSDTVFFLGNFSKNFLIIQKYYFGIGAAIASFLFFFSLGYLSKLSSNYLQSRNAWKVINLFIVVFMSILALYVLVDIFNLKNRIF